MLHQLGLSELLENDLSSYEYFNSLPTKIQRKLEQYDVSSFEDMQQLVKTMKETS